MPRLSGAGIVILCCALLHFAWISVEFCSMLLFEYQLLVPLSTAQAITLLCYPLLGWLADACFTRFLVIRVAAILYTAVSIFGLIVTIIENILFYHYPSQLEGYQFMYILSGVPLLVIVLILGMFEANAIQFGMDQMLEASSDQLSAFIHWYYWGIHFSRGLMVILSICIQVFLSLCILDLNIQSRLAAGILPAGYILALVFFVQMVLAGLAVYFLQVKRKELNIEKTGHNSLSTVYNVLKYAWNHKCPERRSAFTYWEQEIPSRINLGKTKYGGPFTTEEVEDTKTLFRILLLLASLFGLFIADNGFSLLNHCLRTLCPSLPTFITVLSAPNTLSSVSIVICVPVLHFLILPHFRRYVPNMLHRMGLSLAAILVQEMARTPFVLETETNHALSGCKNSNHVVRDCFIHNTPFLINGSCSVLPTSSYCGQEDSLFLWMLIPIAIHSFAYQFGFMTGLEFICAQSPLRVKGLLIGIWYAMSAIKTYNIDIDTMDGTSWFIYGGIHCTLVLVSLFLYCCLAKRYRYRVRDEAVNFNLIVEEIFERQLHQKHEFERKQSLEANERLPLIEGAGGHTH